MFVPKPRGLGNPCMKHHSVRSFTSQETTLFDAIDTSKVEPSVISLRESIIDLRDMQNALLDILRMVAMSLDHNVLANGDILLQLSAEACAYYMNLMHSTDSKTLAPRIPMYLREKMTLVELYNKLIELYKVLDTMCKVNAAVINMSLRGSKSKTKDI